MKKVAFITPPDAELGFRLAGVDQYVAELKDVMDTMRQALSDPSTGVLILDERFIKEIGEERLRAMERQWDGILLVLPSPKRPAEKEEDYLSRLIRRAIGYHVRLKI